MCLPWGTGRGTWRLAKQAVGSSREGQLKSWGGGSLLGVLAAQAGEIPALTCWPFMLAGRAPHIQKVGAYLQLSSGRQSDRDPPMQAYSKVHPFGSHHGAYSQESACRIAADNNVLACVWVRMGVCVGGGSGQEDAWLWGTILHLLAQSPTEWLATGPALGTLAQQTSSMWAWLSLAGAGRAKPSGGQCCRDTRGHGKPAKEASKKAPYGTGRAAALPR